MKRFLICIVSLLLGICLLGGCTGNSNDSSGNKGNYDHGGNSADWSPAA